MVAWAEGQKQSLLVSQLRLDAVAGKVSVTEAEVRDYYEQHSENYRSLPGVIEMTEVLVDTRAEAEDILARARSGERLAELAQRHSVRSSMKPVGGHTFADKRSAHYRVSLPVAVPHLLWRQQFQRRRGPTRADGGPGEIQRVPPRPAL